MLQATDVAVAPARASTGQTDAALPPVIMVGGFPPPMNGAAKNNLALSVLIQQRGMNVVRFDTSGTATSHARNRSYYTERLQRNAEAAMGLFRQTASSSFYTVPDGGLGLLYSTVIVALATMRFPRIVIHHRTYSYIDRSSPLMKTIVALTRRRSMHVFLSPSMKQRFEERYGEVRSLVASNAYFLPPPRPVVDVSAASGPKTIGHLSNLCAEKGFFDVADTFEELMRRGADVNLALAGPVIESAVQERLDKLKAAYGARVFHAGPVNGEEKFKFLAGVDVFLFPTRYRLEAEPNVVLEALSSGIPVVAFDRGAMRDIIGPQDGFVVGVEDDFAPKAADWISALFESEDAGRRPGITQRTAVKIAEATKAYEGLFSYLSGRG
jgi:glycosyltransferase involved in cell wall biosynthesis